MSAEPAISKNTPIQLGVVIVALSVIVGAIAWAARISTQVEAFVTMIEEMEGSRYSLPMASEDALREAIGNPGHRVPDPRNPGQYVVVESVSVTTERQ